MKKNAIFILLTLLTLFSLLFSSIPVFAQQPMATGVVYYVSSSGNDTNPGTITEPWRTIQHAADALVAGDTVYIRAGTYYEQVIPANSGSNGNVITYAAYPGEVVTIDGTGVNVPEFEGLFVLVSRSYIRVSGLRVINSNYYGIVAENSSYITIDNNYTYNTYSSGISTWGCNHVVVDHNEVAGACYGPWQESLSISNTDTFEVSNNRVHDVMPGTDGKEGISIKDASTHGKVHGNQVYNLNRVGLYVDAEAGHLYDVEVYQNVVHHIEAMGFDLASEQGGLLENIRLYNNISYDNLVGLWLSACCIATHPFKDITIINNTFAYNGRGTWGGGISIENLQVQNVIIRNNISSQNIYSQMGADPSVMSELTVDHNLTDGDRDPQFEFNGASDLVGVSPQFVNPSGADFHLAGTSPAINSGSSQGAPADDFAGHPRDAHPDIGAYEFGSIFDDVPASYWASSWIERLYHAGITSGCSLSPLLYCPEDSVTRAQMAKFLELGIHGAGYTPPAGTGNVFVDVPLSYWAVNWIERLYADGITSGCLTSPLSYCPDQAVTRDQMAKFLLIARHGAGYTPPAVGGSTGFGDVPTSYWAAPWIKQLAAEGITSGCGGGNYCPGQVVTRSQMAKFLVLTFGLP
jgi:hypothetical protein